MLNQHIRDQEKALRLGTEHVIEIKRMMCFWKTEAKMKEMQQSRINTKMAIYCPQGSGTLRQQLFMMH